MQPVLRQLGAPSSRRLFSSGLSLHEAAKQVKLMNVSCHDETINIAIRLNVDPRKPNQSVRGSVVLPNGLGKKVAVAVFARGPAAEDAKSAGADFVGDDDLVARITEGAISFDKCICTPEMLGVVGKVARILGPRGLMPNVKVGTICSNVGEAVRSAKQGQVEFRAEKQGIVHGPLAKCSFTLEQIQENINKFVDAVQEAKPSGAKGAYVRSAVLVATRGHSVDLDISVTPFAVRKAYRR
uniref:Ribosomal protein n=1 Tax=Spongospora subterranea TaxID=70186 RepID=A0A0H5QLJ0_9EUKA|eukprot:CRZ03015.1 hypothetical protein [Spongospora subterranea]